MPKFITILAFLLILSAILSCTGDIPPIPVRTNPLDANNPDTQGDPYQLRGEIADGGIRLSWDLFEWQSLIGFSLHRMENNGTFSLLTQVNATTDTYTDRTIQNGHRYDYYIVARGESGDFQPSEYITVTINSDPFLFIEGETVTHTPTRNVTLTILAYGAEQMLLSNDSAFAGASWETATSTKLWQLETGIGTKSVYLRVIYTSEDTSEVVINRIDPSILNPVLDIIPDSTYINHSDITLSMLDVGATEMKISNYLDSSSVNWQPYADTLNWNILSGDGWKRVYAWFRNDFYPPTVPVVDSVGLDTRADIASFGWFTSNGRDTLELGDSFTFTLQMQDDAFGPETGGVAEVTVEGWERILLIDQANGSYSKTITISVNTVSVIDAGVSASFVDRVSNNIYILHSDRRLTVFGLDAGDERAFPLGNSGKELIMVWIPPGAFEMGSPNEEQDSIGGEVPAHTVSLSQGFWLGKCEMTQAQWEAIMHNNPASGCGVGDDYPIYDVSWNDIQNFVSELNHVFRLPTESEWEYACRGGTTTRFYWGEDPNYEEIHNYAIYGNDNPGGTSEVGTKLPNNWGLYDMSGNVWEWCEDWYHQNYIGAPTDGSAWRYPSSSSRVIRGGGWFSDDKFCRSAVRGYFAPSYQRGHGFRLARDAE